MTLRFCDFQVLQWIVPVIVAAFSAGAVAADSSGSRSGGPAPRFPEVSQLPAQAALPDPRVSFDGKRVANRTQWFRQRRPELKALFEHYMYGTMPPAPRRVKATVERVDTKFFDGKATEKLVTIAFGPPDMPRIHLLMVVPNARRGPAPVFLGLTFCGVDAVVDDPHVPLPTGWMYAGPGVTDHHATGAGRGSQINTWNLEQSIDRGYAVAVFYNGDVEPDDPGTTAGVRAWFKRHDPTHPYDFGAVAAWAWGLSRAVDYLVTDRDVDARRIAVVGHSRNGKAAMLAAAFDERIALAIPLQAGCGGTAPSRGHVGESVRQINDHFPHWFNAEFKKFNQPVDRLPFDQHCLIALCAPRPVLLSNATEDTWANPAGQLEMLQAADPVYRLLGVEGLDASQLSESRHLVLSRLGYFIRPGKHSMTKIDWDAFLDFADKFLAGHRLKPGASVP